MPCLKRDSEPAARRYSDLPNLAAARWIRAGDVVMAIDPAMARAYHRRAGQLRDARRGAARPPGTVGFC